MNPEIRLSESNTYAVNPRIPDSTDRRSSFWHPAMARYCVTTRSYCWPSTECRACQGASLQGFSQAHR